MKKMGMLEFYESILLTAGLSVASDGAVSVSLGSTPEPMLLNRKRVVIPTKEQMANPDFSQRVMFHPLAENIIDSETSIFARYRLALTARINLVITNLMSTLLTIAASPAMQKNLTVQQSEFLTALGDVDIDEKTVQNFTKLMEQCDFSDADKMFVHITMKRNGDVGGVKYTRVGVVTSPMYKVLEMADNYTVFGVKIRAKDVKAIKALLAYVLPGVEDTKKAFNTGSDSKIAPYTLALLSTVAKVINCLNDVSSLFYKDEPTVLDKMTFRTDWIALVNDLSPIINEIRMVPNQTNPNDVVQPQTTSSANAPLQSFNAVTAPVASTLQPAQPVAQPVMQSQSVYAQGYAPQPVAQSAVYGQPVAAPVATSTGSSFGDWYARTLGVQAQSVPNPVPAAQAVQYIQQAQPIAQPTVYGQPAVYGQPMGQQVVYNQYGQPVAQPVAVGSYGYPVYQ